MTVVIPIHDGKSWSNPRLYDILKYCFALRENVYAGFISGRKSAPLSLYQLLSAAPGLANKSYPSRPRRRGLLCNCFLCPHHLTAGTADSSLQVEEPVFVTRNAEERVFNKPVVNNYFKRI